MPDDQKRVDISADLNQPDNDLLSDVQKATEQVKKRRADDRAKDAAEARQRQSRKTSALLIAVGAVLVLLVSYWVVFARQSGVSVDAATASREAAAARAKKMNSPIKPPCVTNCAPTAPPRVGAPVGRDSQSVQQPPHEYEQPSYDPGM